MFRSINEILGYSILAKDGDIGKVKDFYFNDEHWIVRYLVVDIGGWISGRKVLVSPSSFIGEPNWKEKTFPVDLTKKEVEESPEIDFDKPVSRQKEKEISKYFNWPIYWSNGLSGYVMPYNMKTTIQVEDIPEEEIERKNQHLRSVKELEGYNIKANDGKIGHVENFIVDDISWNIRYMVIDTKNFLPGKKVIIDPYWIDNIDWYDTSIYIDHTVKEVEKSPEFDPKIPINRKYEEVLYDFYGKPKYWDE